MTPYQLNLFIKVFNERQKQQKEDDLVLTYLGAYWQRVKKMPSLKKVLGQEKPKQMTAEEMLNKVRQLNAALGGEVK